MIASVHPEARKDAGLDDMDAPDARLHTRSIQGVLRDRRSVGARQEGMRL